ncbi:hypothetical protein [Caballeronia sp. GAWG1-1]|uniref:hypothetical protein n=1 Tax=Caballeronia sp. GAWG1-1 TaxID=2921742 RepID=UPI002028D5E8|nr:hypothetical protein [Caballeronia sp. GAWG1-1]
MSDAWQYQVRIRLAPDYATKARQNMDDVALAPLASLLRTHDAELQCQFDAFAGYVAEAEREGTEHYPLYQWTRDTIEDPVKKAKYIEWFTFHVQGQEVYDKRLADALEADLTALNSEAISEIRKIDTNPARNPQPPKQP